MQISYVVLKAAALPWSCLGIEPSASIFTEPCYFYSASARSQFQPQSARVQQEAHDFVTFKAFVVHFALS